MAQLDPTLVFRGPGGVIPDYNRTQQEKANLKGTGLDNQLRQQSVDMGDLKMEQVARARNAQRIYDDLVAKHTGQLGVADVSGTQPGVPETKDDKGAPVGQLQPQGTNPTTDGPSMMTAPDEAPAGLPGEAAQSTPPNAEAAADVGGLPREKPSSAKAAPVAPAAAPRFGTNWPEVFKGMVKAGYSQEAFAHDRQLQADMKLGLENHEKELTITAKKAEMMGAAAQSVLANKVDPNEPDPAKAQMQKQMWQTAAMTALQSGLKNGWIDQQHEQALMAQVQQGWTPQLESEVRQLADQGMKAHEQLTAHIAEAKEQRDALVFGPEQAKKMADARKAAMETAAQTVAGVVDQVSFDNWYKRQPQSVQDDVKALYQGGFNTETIGAIEAMGQTAQQREGNALRADAAADRRAQNDISNDFRRIMVGIAQENAARGSAQDRAERRADVSEGNKLQDREQEVAKAHGQIGKQLELAHAGKPFYQIDDKGRTKGHPIDKEKSLGGQEEFDAARAELEQRYEDLNAERADIVRRKNEILVKYGHEAWKPTAPKVEKVGPPTPEKTEAPPQSKGKVMAVPPAIAAGLQVGIPRKVKDPNGNMVTLVKRADGKVYQQ